MTTTTELIAERDQLAEENRLLRAALREPAPYSRKLATLTERKRGILKVLLRGGTSSHDNLSLVRIGENGEWPMSADAVKVHVSNIRKWAKAKGAPATFKIHNVHGVGYAAEGIEDMKKWLGGDWL